MTSSDPIIKHRHSIRLKEFDYSMPGNYFVTICVQNNDCLFGEIQDEKMILNDAGQMIEKWCKEIPNKFQDIEVSIFVIMPNHFHAIFTNVGADLCVCPIDNESVGADLCVCPKDKGEHIGSPLRNHDTCEQEGSPLRNDDTCEHEGLTVQNDDTGEHIGSPLHTVIQWFKTMTTNDYIHGVKKLGWKPFNKKLWQRNYYEHIIRNEEDYQNTYNYIYLNPVNWNKDEYF